MTALAYAANVLVQLRNQTQQSLMRMLQATRHSSQCRCSARSARRKTIFKGSWSTSIPFGSGGDTGHDGDAYDTAYSSPRRLCQCSLQLLC